MNEIGSSLHNSLAIHLEQLYSGPTNTGQRNDYRPIQNKMVAPILCTWIEERCNLTSYRGNRSQISTLVAIAIKAGIGQIAFHRQASMLFGNDVINFMPIAKLRNLFRI